MPELMLCSPHITYVNVSKWNQIKKKDKKLLSFFSEILYSSTHSQAVGSFFIDLFSFLNRDEVFPCAQKEKILKFWMVLYLRTEFRRCTNTRNSPRVLFRRWSSTNLSILKNSLSKWKTHYIKLQSAYLVLFEYLFLLRLIWDF